MLAGYSFTMRQKAYFPDSYSVQSHLSPAAYQGLQLHPPPVVQIYLDLRTVPQNPLNLPKILSAFTHSLLPRQINGLRDLQVMLI